MTATTTAAGAVSPRRTRRRRTLGPGVLGWAFTAPYVAFLGAIFAYPVGFSVYMSLHDYFFAAPNAIVDRPFVGLDNFSTVLSDGAVRQAFGNVAIFLVINVPLTVVLALGLATALNAALPFRTLPARRVLRAVRDGERRAGRRVAVPVQLGRPRQLDPRAAGARPVVAGQPDAGDADDRASSWPGSSSGSSSCSTSLRSRTCRASCTTRPPWTARHAGARSGP